MNFADIKKSKILIILLIVSLLTFFYASGLYRELSFHNIQLNLQKIKDWYATSPVEMLAAFFSVYVLITSLSIPGAIVLTLLSGAVFGVWFGSLIVSVASCVGATIAFLMSRFLFRDALLKKNRARYHRMNAKFKKNGKSYLMSLRLIPVSPFVVINVMMGLTNIKVWDYIWITFIGMIPGTIIYVYAGRKISEIESPSEILTWPILLTLSVIAALPFILKWIARRLPGQRLKV